MEYIYMDWNLVERIFIEEKRNLKRIAYKRVYNVENAEDIVQNTMETICTSVYKRNKIYNLKAWIYKILKYRCIDFYRKNGKVHYCTNDILDNYNIDTVMDDIENLNLYNALNVLREQDKRILIYKIIYGLKNNEISKIFGCCDRTIQRKVAKSLSLLRNKLDAN